MPAPHSHDAFEETIYAVHGFDNHGADDAKFLAVASPGLISADYFREVHSVLAASAGGPPDLAKIGEVMRRHGLTPAPPAAG